MMTYAIIASAWLVTLILAYKAGVSNGNYRAFWEVREILMIDRDKLDETGYGKERNK